MNENTTAMTNNEIPDGETRNAKLAVLSQKSSLLALNKAKSLVMACWHGEMIATTKQVASFYQVSEDSLRKILNRHRDELLSDGLQLVDGNDLQSLKDALSRSLFIAPSVHKLCLWTPRSIVRVGMLLQDGEVASQVRNVVLDQVEKNPNPKQLEIDPWDLTDEQAGQVFSMVFPGTCQEEETEPPSLTTIAESIELVMSQSKVSRKLIALATADAIAHAYPNLSGTMSIARRYLQSHQ